MAPKKSKKTKQQERELQEEAMAEWLARGLNIKDFAMDKMLALWLEEDADEDEDDGEAGALSAKEELMKGFSVLEPVIEQAKEFAETLKETIIEEGTKALKTAWEYAEIPPLKRRRLLREHVTHVHEMDREANKYTIVRQRVMDEWETAQTAEKEQAFGLKKRNARKAPLLQRSREMKDEADREQHGRLMADIEQKRRERMDRELAEKQRLREVREEFAELQRVYRRKMNMKYWQKQYADAKEYADQHSLASDHETREGFDERVELMKAEIAEMNAEEENDYKAAFQRHVTTSSPGIFGAALEGGEYSSFVGGGHREGLDEHTVGLFSSRGFEPENELLRMDFMETQSKVCMLTEKLELVDHVRETLVQDKRTILERKDRLLMEIRQLNSEHDELNRLLAGPPRRDPSEEDKHRFHTLVNRRADFVRQLQDLKFREDNIQKRTELATRSEQSLRPLLVKAQQIETELKQKINNLACRQHDLPVVIGKSIQKNIGALDTRESSTSEQMTIPVPNPTKLYREVVMASKLKLLESAALPVKDHFKRAKQLTIEDWKTKELHQLGHRELEVTKNRLSDIRDRMIEHQRTSLRADLIQAIQRYHQGPMKLRKCIFPLKGHFDWWNSKDPSRCVGLRYDDSLDIIYLPPSEHRGRLRGCIRLPKQCFFRVALMFKLQILIESGEWREVPLNSDEEGKVVDEVTDKISFLVGPDYDSLQEHTFRDLGGHVIVVGGVGFEFYGVRLCYSVEIVHHLGKTPSKTRIVLDNAATYEERITDFREEESQMRLLQRENHVFSELVETMRMQTKRTSSERCADLLQELIEVEQSKGAEWDSSRLHGHQQRFKRLQYAEMLRHEIKKELAHQIDEDIERRQGRMPNQLEADEEPLSAEENSSMNAIKREVSRMEFLARKHVLVEPHYVRAKQSLGDYCSFKDQHPDNTSAPKILEPRRTREPTATRGKISYRKEAIVMGLRLEWREGKTKLIVMHKLYGSAPNGDKDSTSKTVIPQWTSLDTANAVFLASACAKALKQSREAEAKERELNRKNIEMIQQVQSETELVVQQQKEADQRELIEDAFLRQQKAGEMHRRRQQFYAEAIRTTTYNEQVSAQVEFLAQRKKNVLDQTPSDDARASFDVVLRQVKDEYAQKYVDGRLALVKKTWERKEKRIHDQREKERRERDFRINKEHELRQEVGLAGQKELDALRAENVRRTKDQLRIPNFESAVKGTFNCEHIELKAWGTKHDSGLRCKRCGKEMSHSFNEIDHSRGSAPQLDRDVQQHRAQATGGVALHLRYTGHFDQVERERLRQEKEAREIELTDALLYDRMNPKAVEEFNYRHNVNRHPIPVEGSDPLYRRAIHERHRASFQDEILYHGRLRNYQFRISQLSDLHAQTTTMITVQRDFLESVTKENDFVLAKLPLVEKDHARAILLIEEDVAALRALNEANLTLSKARKERERAYYALEGVEDDAELAEFHAPSLIESSDVMANIVKKVEREVEAIEAQAKKCEEHLDVATKDREQCESVLSRLCCRNPGARLRTRYGFCRVKFFREEDKCAVLVPEMWNATIYAPVDELIAIEQAERDAETAMMEAEENMMKRHLQQEHHREQQEITLMAQEEAELRLIFTWRVRKEEEEIALRTALCDVELNHQFEYEMLKRKELFRRAADEAKKLSHYSRVSLKRRQAQTSRSHPGRLDLMRVTRASEKRLAMSEMEQALLSQERSLRITYQNQRDAVNAHVICQTVYTQAVRDTLVALCLESYEEEVYEIARFGRVHNHGNLKTIEAHSSASVHMDIRLDRLWVARRRKYEVLFATWQKEFVKMQALRLEIARRDEILRRQEEERILLEARRKEMLAEERYCRKFYLEEMVLCMQERKAMANVEMEMREYTRQLELEAMKAKYAKMIEDRNKTNDKAARRLEIKVGKNEKHRLHREWAQIRLEDELGMHLREEELSRARTEALERQFDKFLIHQALEGKLAAEREAARIANRLKEAERIAAEKRAAFEAKLVQERMIATVETYHLLTRVEVAWMDAVERSSYWRGKAAHLKTNLQYMKVELERIQAEKDHVVADAMAKRAHAEVCKQRAVEADCALHQAILEQEAAEKTYRKVHFLNSWMDSEVLHDRPQRFRTLYLRDQLHTRYFYLITESIIRRAIVECNEREVARLEARLLQIIEERAFKIKEIGVLKRKHRRQFHMQLKRSELGKLLFGLSQRRLLKEQFQQWVNLWSRRVTVRASFEVKHGLLMQQHRVYEKQVQLARDEINTKLTILHQHQKRRVQCRLCKHDYTEEQNNRYACSYHPGAYELACVKTCPTRQNASSLDATSPSTAASCMVHRARRWLCCDATDEGRYGSNGCVTRFHLPVRNNPSLHDLVEKKEQQENSLLDQIQQQLSELKERDVVGKAKQRTKTTVSKIEQDLAAKRAVAAKFYTLDRR